LKAYQIWNKIGFLANISTIVIMVLTNFAYSKRNEDTIEYKMFWINWVMFGFTATYKLLALTVKIVLFVKTREAYKRYLVDFHFFWQLNYSFKLDKNKMFFITAKSWPIRINGAQRRINKQVLRKTSINLIQDVYRFIIFKFKKILFYLNSFYSSSLQFIRIN